METITVIGTGYVGLVSGTCFAEMGNRVICCDIDAQKIEGLRLGRIPIYEPGLEELAARNASFGRLRFTTDIPGAIREARIIYVAVGTPMSQDGAADLRAIQAAARTIGENLNRYKVIVIKSTVPVGTAALVEQVVWETLKNKMLRDDTANDAGDITERMAESAGDHRLFDVVSNPEFLREGAAVHDCLHMERAIIGAANERAASIVAKLHEPFQTKVFLTDRESAEMIKYAANAFLAMKISFINDIANICERLGADVTKVAAGIGLDSRIGSKFLQAGAGYGGSCFPKDTAALVRMAEEAGYDFQLLKAVMETNAMQRQRLLEKLENAVGPLAGKTIAVLGLSFKPQTNDMREAPSLTVIKELLKKGAQVRAYDPIAIPEARRLIEETSESVLTAVQGRSTRWREMESPDANEGAERILGKENRISYYKNIYEALQDADAAMVLTEWEEVRKVDLALLRRLMRMPLVVDGRNCWEPDVMKQAGIRYYSVGRAPTGELAIASAAIWRHNG